MNRSDHKAEALTFLIATEEDAARRESRRSDLPSLSSAREKAAELKGVPDAH